MRLLPVLVDKLNSALAPSGGFSATRRDAALPAIPGKVHAVIGMRRAGKSTWLRQQVEERRRHLPPERALYLSFDDDRLARADLEQLSLLLEEFYRRFPSLRGAETVHWFLDEVQEIPGWERFVRRIMDTERVEVVVSGSSARLLSREVHTSLRGRGMETILRPFGFREALRHLGEEPEVPPSTWTPRLRSRVEGRFREYLVQGGFPEAQGLPAALRVELLQGYVDTLLFRDIVERHGVTQVAALRWIVRHALRNPGGRTSAHRLHGDLRSQGHAVGKDAVHALLGHLQDAFLLSSVPIATDSERRRNSNPRVLYPADPGLIKAFDPGGRSRTGRALETVVLHELERRGAAVEYVRTKDGYEVDFLARYRDGREELVQVCADASDEGTRTRELRALVSAGAEFPHAVRVLLLLDRPSGEVPWPEEVTVQSTCDWVLT